nr:MAG TPA: hypothetical protein [Caudoviricetes sp.]
MPNEFVFSGELDGLFIELGPTPEDPSAAQEVAVDA